MFEDVRNNFMLCTSLHLLEGNRFMQISIFEFCVDFQFHFLILFHIDFLLVKLIHTLVVHVCIGISLRQVVIDMLFVAQVPMSSHVHPSELYLEVFFGMLD